MSSTQDSQGPQGQSSAQRPPYAPRTQSLGGVPDIIPDIPVTAVFLLLYVIFTIVHFTILKKNKARGHKFIFSGMLFGFCNIRIVTMSLRIAWACYRTNIGLGIAAQIFVYVGTVILYIVNWFFTQRIVRAQHPRFGWSLPYRIFHRGALVFLICCLLMLIVAAIQQFFTLNTNTLRIDRDMQLTGQTYFSAFCFAPIVLVILSLVLPRKGTEKFGAGRLRINITILVIAVLILSTGQIFRCVIMWLPPVALRTAQGISIDAPWYFTKACFYAFNFTTEILVVIFYAIIRVDLRFHVPNGANKAGDYREGRKNRYTIGVIGNEKNLKRASAAPVLGVHANSSNDTLHEYESSLFDDTRTLADSLRYPSSVLEVDQQTGHWKIKRMSQNTSMSSLIRYSADANSVRNTYVAEDAPPVPNLPADWPLRESQISPGSIPVPENQNRGSRSAGQASKRSNELEGHDMNQVDMGNAIADAIAKLEANSKANKTQRAKNDTNSKASPPDYDAVTPVRKPKDLTIKKVLQPNSDIPRKHTYSPLESSTDLPRNHDYSASAGLDLPKKLKFATPEEQISPPPSRDARSFQTAEEEFRRFSFEAPPQEGESEYRNGNEKGHRTQATMIV